MTRVKVCGLATIDQVEWAIELGYDAIGVVVSPRSKRYCHHSDAQRIAKHAKGKIESFVVAYTLDEVGSLREDFDIIQLYTPAEIDNLAYSSSIPPEESMKCKYFFYDKSIGTGVYQEIPDWVGKLKMPVYIAGGLNADNVGGVIKELNPFGVDVSSSVETSPLVKNKAKMAAFIAAIKSKS